MLNPVNGQYFHLGLNDSDLDSKFSHIDTNGNICDAKFYNQPYYTNHFLDEPQDCIVVGEGVTGHWLQRPCTSESYNIICQIRPTPFCG